MDNQARRDLISYEYKFETTPSFILTEEGWDLVDVFLKHLENGAFVFVPVFRRTVKMQDVTSPKEDEYDSPELVEWKFNQVKKNIENEGLTHATRLNNILLNLSEKEIPNESPQVYEN